MMVVGEVGRVRVGGTEEGKQRETYMSSIRIMGLGAPDDHG